MLPFQVFLEGRHVLKEALWLPYIFLVIRVSRPVCVIFTEGACDERLPAPANRH
jgi:hypothetical protein